MDYPVNYQIKKYKPRTLTEKQLMFCEAYLAEQSTTIAARLSGYKAPKRSGRMLIKCKRILDYLNHREREIVKVPVTFESKVKVLQHVLDEAIPLNEPLTKNVDTGIKVIQELNKMQGHYAAVESKNLNVNVDIDMKEASTLFDSLLIDSTLDH